jgi:hypothetical protein
VRASTVGMPVTQRPRADPDVQFSRIRFFCCTRLCSVKQSLQVNTLRRLTSVIQGHALLAWSRTRLNCSQAGSDHGIEHPSGLGARYKYRSTGG